MLLFYGLVFLGCKASGILAPQLEIKLVLPALEDVILTTTAGKSRDFFFKYYDVIVALNFNYSCKWFKFYKVLRSVKVDKLKYLYAAAAAKSLRSCPTLLTP